MKIRRLWPLLLLIGLWLLIWAWPLPRAAWLRAIGPTFADQNSSGSSFYYGAIKMPKTVGRAKNDRRVLILEAGQNETKIAIAKLDALAEKFPDDPFILGWRLKHSTNFLFDNRNEGPLSNPNYPKPPPKEYSTRKVAPRAEWEKMAQIARRGQKLQPNNTYFDWMLLYALVGMRRDKEARAVLKAATRKTDYDDFTRQEIETKIAVRELSGPIAPVDKISLWAGTLFPHFARFRQTARVLMEGAIAQRAQRDHQGAIDTSFGLLHLGSVLRQRGYSIIGSLVGSAMEKIALFSWGVKWKAPKTNTMTLAQSQTFNLAGYAAAHNRPEVAKFATNEWNMLGKWSKLPWNGLGGYEKSFAASLLLERWGRIVWRSLLPVLVLWIATSLLARRFRWNGAPPIVGAGKRILGIAALFWLALFAGDWGLFLHGWNPTIAFEEFLWQSLENYDLATAAPFLVRMGALAVVVLTALGFAAKWQRSHREKPPSLRERLRSLVPPTAANLANFDFGFVLALVGRLTFWILLLASFAAFVWLPDPRANAEDNGNLIYDYSWAIFAIVGIVVVAFQLGVWRHLPHKRAALVLSFHATRRMAGAYLLGASLVLALLVFAALPAWNQFNREFDKTIQIGELELARIKAGL